MRAADRQGIFIIKKTNQIQYLSLDKVEPECLLSFLNKPSIRTHLVDHPLFDMQSSQEWIQSKVEVDSTAGCRVRAVLADGSFAGWCGIQLEEKKPSIAIVIDEVYWGLGKQIFRELLNWAREFGHNTVFIELRHTRPEYRFLKNLSKSVTEGQLLGEKFITYEIDISQPL